MGTGFGLIYGPPGQNHHQQQQLNSHTTGTAAALTGAANSDKLNVLSNANGVLYR